MCFTQRGHMNQFVSSMFLFLFCYKNETLLSVHSMRWEWKTIRIHVGYRDEGE